jgi:hypothetical protein
VAGGPTTGQSDMPEITEGAVDADRLSGSGQRLFDKIHGRVRTIAVPSLCQPRRLREGSQRSQGYDQFVSHAAVNIFANETSTTAIKAGEVPWSKIVEEHKARRIRPDKSGVMLGVGQKTGRTQNPKRRPEGRLFLFWV